MWSTAGPASGLASASGPPRGGRDRHSRLTGWRGSPAVCDPEPAVREPGGGPDGRPGWPVDSRVVTDKTGALRTREANTPTTWRCLTCHLEVVDTMLPRKCPRCGASRVKFLEVGAQAENE